MNRLSLGDINEYSDQQLNEVFTTFDQNNNGKVERDEMVGFVKQLVKEERAKDKGVTDQVFNFEKVGLNLTVKMCVVEAEAKDFTYLMIENDKP